MDTCAVKRNRQSSSAPAACKHTHGCLFHGNISTHPGPSNVDRPMTSRLAMCSLHCWLSKMVATFIIASYPNLQPNSNDTTIVLLAQILQQLATFTNGTPSPSTLTLPMISRTNALDRSCISMASSSAKFPWVKVPPLTVWGIAQGDFLQSANSLCCCRYCGCV